MMRKELICVLLLFFVMINLSLVFAAEDSTVAKKGYDCLKSKTDNKCSALASEEKIFSFLAIGACKQELLSDAVNGECWPKPTCKLKTTSQAMLALDEANVDVNNSVGWILSKKTATINMDWLLQVDSNKPAICSITYDERDYDIGIDAEKKITYDSSPGSCLSLYGDDYWLEISRDCYGRDFEISCNETFRTSLLYKEQSSPALFVSEETHSGSAEGKTTERVESFCLKDGASCSYEGTLWASMILNKLNEDTSAYVPYLVSLSSENEVSLPEVFLYVLLGESYRDEILQKQQEDKWWIASGDKFYDTALALFPFQNEELREKTNSMSWLEEAQGTDGCWQGGNIKDTAFILYSLWPDETPSNIREVTEGQVDCEDSNYYCLSPANCENAEGEELDYSGCFGVSSVCCSKQLSLETCEFQQGVKCSLEEICSGGEEVSASDLDSDEICCIEGECRTRGAGGRGSGGSSGEGEDEEESECEKYSGSCRTSCFSGEQETEYDCFGRDVCCLGGSSGGAKNYTGIIILSISIVLVVLGIVFRNKLKLFFSKFKKEDEKSGQGQQGPGPFIGPGAFPPSSGAYPKMMPRKIIPQSSQPVRRTLPLRNQEGEFGGILKKLKEMSGDSSPAKKQEAKKEVVVKSHVRRINK